VRRVRGRPRSSNGASSLHLRWVWDTPPPPLVEARATLTVLEPTVNEDLRFWALQASFAGVGGRRFGAGHVGLQRHAGHPGACAANWGGYAAAGGELTGTDSRLPSKRGNRNTRDLAWDVGRPYRLAIRRGAAGWAGTIDDVVLRELHAGGDRLDGLVVWSEVFARCEDPHAVRWSDLAAVTADGEVVHPVAVAVNYQAWSAGGCTNTDAELDGAGGVVQRTGARRITPQGAVIRL
jgi:hypothetical protein